MHHPSLFYMVWQEHSERQKPTKWCMQRQQPQYVKLFSLISLFQTCQLSQHRASLIISPWRKLLKVHIHIRIALLILAFICQNSTIQSVPGVSPWSSELLSCFNSSLFILSLFVALCKSSLAAGPEDQSVGVSGHTNYDPWPDIWKLMSEFLFQFLWLFTAFRGYRILLHYPGLIWPWFGHTYSHAPSFPILTAISSLFTI